MLFIFQNFNYFHIFDWTYPRRIILGWKPKHRNSISVGFLVLLAILTWKVCSILLERWKGSTVVSLRQSRRTKSRQLSSSVSSSQAIISENSCCNYVQIAKKSFDLSIFYFNVNRFLDSKYEFTAVLEKHYFVRQINNESSFNH